LYLYGKKDVVFFQSGGYWKLRSKFIYLRILHKYGCCIYPSAIVGRGFRIAHPVGIVIGECTIGEEFTILQNTTIGIKKPQDVYTHSHPYLGDNIMLGCNSVILGGCHVANNVFIGASSVVCSDLIEAGVYVGSPAKKIK
jgi:serine O-acetyltransferase